MLLLESITDLLETKRLAGFHTAHHKIRAHTNIRGNDLVEAIAKMKVRYFNTLPPAQTTRVDIGEIAPPAQHIRSCTRLHHQDPTRPSLLAPTALLSAVLGGPSRKRTSYECSPSRARPNNSGVGSEMRYYVAYTTPLSTGASSSPTKQRGTALTH